MVLFGTCVVLLLLNLLIAIFNASYEQHRNDAHLEFLFHKYSIISKHMHEYPNLPAPLSAPYALYAIFHVLWLRAGGKDLWPERLRPPPPSPRPARRPPTTSTLRWRALLRSHRCQRRGLPS